MKTQINTIEGQPIYWDGEIMSFHGCGRVDNDGSGGAHGDKYHQNDTSLHCQGKPLNASIDRFIAIPLALIKAVPGAVLGCQAYVTYNGLRMPATVGDVSWVGKVTSETRLGEISTSLAEDLGINSNPVSGGVNSPSLCFEIEPGVPAIVGDRHYKLQPLG